MIVERIGQCELFLGECREVIASWSDGVQTDAFVTDPPYGVNLGARTGSSRYLNEKYAGFDDTPEYIRRSCVPAIQDLIARTKRGVMTPGNKCGHLYPTPADIGVWYNPASTNRGAWGFSFVNAFIYYYGRDPHNVGRGMRPNSLSGACDSVAGIAHPCPKPLLFTSWLVERASKPDEIVVDPFMGSGTTGVACVRLGRKFVGIEQNPTYFAIACERVRRALKEPPLPMAATAVVQEAMAV